MAAPGACFFGPIVAQWENALDDLLAPFHIPRHPLLYAGGRVADGRTGHAAGVHAFAANGRALVIAGMAGHSVLPLERPPTGAFGLLLSLLAQTVGWPVAKGGTQSIADALDGYAQSVGVDVVCGWPVQTVDESPRARAYFF